MNSKERLMTAIHKGKPDRLPATVHQWQGYHLEEYMGGISDLEAFKKVGLDAQIRSLDAGLGNVGQGLQLAAADRLQQVRQLHRRQGGLAHQALDLLLLRPERDRRRVFARDRSFGRVHREPNRLSLGRRDGQIRFRN